MGKLVLVCFFNFLIKVLSWVMVVIIWGWICFGSWMVIKLFFWLIIGMLLNNDNCWELFGLIFFLFFFVLIVFFGFLLLVLLFIGIGFWLLLKLWWKVWILLIKVWSFNFFNRGIRWLVENFVNCKFF